MALQIDTSMGAAGQVSPEELDSDWSGGGGSPRKVLERLPRTAHNWDDELKHQQKLRQSPVYDDGTMTFFWRAHTVLTLLVFCAVMVYVAVFEDPDAHDTQYNFKRGLIACVMAFLMIGATQTPDGPFCRPHPAFWRLVLCLSIVYELALIFLLFQSVDYSRGLMAEFDSRLGKPLPEKSYANSCVIYDTSNPADPWHNVFEKFDLFVPTHFFGWWVKTLMLRDYWLCHTMSILFEILEYTLEHQLPNFAECWWDHLMMDIIICNALGIWLGMRTLEYLSWKTYHWRGIWNIPSYREKLHRLAAQFTPYSWTDFEWKPTTSLKRWCAMLGVISMFLLAELNTFYLKFVLWIPPEHPICVGRLLFFVFMGTVSMRETFEFLDNPDCKRFGRQSWIIASIIITEVLIVMKYEPQTVFKPLPQHISLFWIVGASGLILFTIWKFYLKTHLFLHQHSKLSPKHLPCGNGTNSSKDIHNSTNGNNQSNSRRLRNKPKHS